MCSVLSRLRGITYIYIPIFVFTLYPFSGFHTSIITYRHCHFLTRSAVWYMRLETQYPCIVTWFYPAKSDERMSDDSHVLIPWRLRSCLAEEHAAVRCGSIGIIHPGKFSEINLFTSQILFLSWNFVWPIVNW